jgi:endonuclease/exonuclease/phosphatase family metal-dependent hydrolase
MTAGRPTDLPAAAFLPKADVREARMRRLPVHVITWNLHGIPSLTPGRREQRMKLAGDRLRSVDADIVLLQEVFFPADLKILKKRIGPDYVLVDDVPRRAYPPWFIPIFNLGGLFMRFRRSGLAAFVHRRWQVLASRFEEYRDETSELRVWEGDGYADKGLQRIELLHHKTRRPLTVFNTHTQSLRAERKVRGRQIGQLAAAAYAVDHDVPVLVAGDFNVRPEEPLYNVMTRDFRWTDLTTRIDGCGERLGFDEVPGEKCKRRRDYIFALPSARWRLGAHARFICNIADDIPYSDHHGIEAHISIRERRWQDELSAAGRPPSPRGDHWRGERAAPNVPLAILAAQTLRGPSTRRAWLLALAGLGWTAWSGKDE